ncbi:hypothetical protein FKG94_20915 [Exilibacterium tricleocarpae]|uniref:Uncharacterized protein n=1 Tax=Exilibacterium tricleocarpae TaxID=2591008 RepID=A0A545T0T2_9GAMM|nr:hypothetical protein [Exilibacterium tricleocarpae]TQV70789.1 hypothetical protein FKG94_20915 [Exilibacterium tricleocarpae]
MLAAEAAVWYVAGAALFAAQLVESLVQGVSFGDALKAGIISGISGAAFSAIGTSAWDFIGGSELLTQSPAFGVVGGITSTLQGGKFGHGFISAGVGGCSEVP